jgi:hypothetical protein
MCRSAILLHLVPFTDRAGTPSGYLCHRPPMPSGFKLLMPPHRQEWTGDDAASFLLGFGNFFAAWHV